MRSCMHRSTILLVRASRTSLSKCATPATLSAARSFSLLARGAARSTALTPPSRLNYSPVRTFAAGGEPVKVPPLADSVRTGTIGKIHKNVGDAVKTDDTLISLETDKVTIDVNAPFSGTITELLVKLDDTVEVGQELLRIAKGAAPAADASKAAPAPAAAAKPATQPAPTAPAAAAPKAEPAKAVAQPAPAASTHAPAKAAAPAAAALPSGERSESKVKMTSIRKRIATRLKDSQNTLAMLTTFQECDTSAVADLRNVFGEAFLKKHGVKLGFMSVFIKAAVAALQEQPIVNASIQGEEIVYKNYNDISVAVATPRGLVVPVLRDADKKSMADLEKELGALGQRARNDQITIEEMVGGTFTISNGGVYGSLMGTPIVNPPQSAILGMHGIFKRPVVVNDKIEIRPMMYLALTYDHRLIDGREAVTFLRKVKDVVEDPRRLLLDL